MRLRLLAEVPRLTRRTRATPGDGVHPSESSHSKSRAKDADFSLTVDFAEQAFISGLRTSIASSTSQQPPSTSSFPPLSLFSLTLSLTHLRTPSSSSFTMVKDIIRDSTLGYLVNTFSNGRLFPFADQREDYVVPQRYLQQISPDTSSFPRTLSSAPTLVASPTLSPADNSTLVGADGVCDKIKTGDDVEKQGGETPPPPSSAAEPAYPWLVTFEENDQDRPQCVSLTLSTSILLLTFLRHQKLVSSQEVLCRLLDFAAHLCRLWSVSLLLDLSPPASSLTSFPSLHSRFRHRSYFSILAPVLHLD